MKTLFFVLNGMLLSVFASANTTNKTLDSNVNTGIAFHTGSWEEALQLAEKEGKPIFLDISASWCSACKKLKSKSFTDEQVAKFYNTNFINVALDGEKGEGNQLADKYEVEKYPSLIFVDSKGKVIAQTEGYQSPKKLIEIGKEVTQ